MHEVGLMQNILDLALEKAQAQGAQQIHEIQVRVGDASGVTPESLDLAFEVVKRGTIAEKAQFKVESVPIVSYCRACDQEFRPVDLLLYECPQCHQISSEVRQGKELELAALEIS
ncbi:MAG: hydrogenase maturation nickel metallochaperone HypA [Gloeobacterales cyanobacterium]